MTAAPTPAHAGWAEWTAAGLSFLLVLGLLGVVLREALGGDDGPPRVAVFADSVVAQPAGYLVHFTARNDGGQTASQLQVEGALRRGDTEVERSRATIDWVPPGARRSGGLLFTQDPRRLRLELRATGFDLP